MTNGSHQVVLVVQFLVQICEGVADRQGHACGVI